MEIIQPLLFSGSHSVSLESTFGKSSLCSFQAITLIERSMKFTTVTNPYLLLIKSTPSNFAGGDF